MQFTAKELGVIRVALLASAHVSRQNGHDTTIFHNLADKVNRLLDRPAVAKLYLFAKVAVMACIALEESECLPVSPKRDAALAKNKHYHDRYNRLLATLTEAERRKAISLIGRINKLRYTVRLTLCRRQKRAKNQEL